ncbi:hypothetical protein [Paenibacillus turpanensis]|nr:hypothetical protein [Paenibacillus turpanensis]
MIRLFKQGDEGYVKEMMAGHPLQEVKVEKDFFRPEYSRVTFMKSIS